MAHLLSYPNDDEKHRRWKDEGRGEGQGAGYVSYIRDKRDYRGFGATHDIKCSLTGRMTIVSTAVLPNLRFAAEFTGRFSAIDEYKDVDLGLTQNIARTMGVAHPSDRKTGEPRVLLVTFRLTLRDSPPERPQVIPVVVVQPSTLDNFNDIVTLEILRRAWKESHGQTLKFVFDDVESWPRALVDNLNVLQKHRFPRAGEPHPHYFEQLEADVRAAVMKANTEMTLNVFSQQLDAEMSVKPGSCMASVLRLVWTGQLQVDLFGPLIGEQPVTEVARRSGVV